VYTKLFKINGKKRSVISYGYVHYTIMSTIVG
jgi:hypothetical protein